MLPLALGLPGTSCGTTSEREPLRRPGACAFFLPVSCGFPRKPAVAVFKMAITAVTDDVFLSGV